jgi:hypothetical protein
MLGLAPFFAPPASIADLQLVSYPSSRQACDEVYPSLKKACGCLERCDQFVVSHKQPPATSSLFAWLISQQPEVLFSQNKPATNNQPAVLFSQNKPAPAISHQPTEQAAD